MVNKTTCPKCLGTGEVMIPNEKKGFHYDKCNLCDTTGEVSEQLANDYIFSLSEEFNELDDE